MSSIQVPSAIEMIRGQPELFFPDGKVTMAELISKVLRDVGGVPEVRADVWRSGPFTMVTADRDWMRSDRAEFEHLFDRFVPPTPPRANCSRAEVFLAATCEGVLAIGEKGSFSLGLTEEGVPPEMLRHARTAARSLIWKLSE